MAPVKFGLFKSKSRDQPEQQPSTENLIQSSTSDSVVAPGSPVPSTSKGVQEEMVAVDISALNLDSEDDDEISERIQSRKDSDGSHLEVDNHLEYQQLKNQTSTDATSSTLCDEIDQIPYNDEIENTTIAIDDDASTSFDVNSLQYDESSLAPSEDWSVNCGALKKKKGISKEARLLRDIDMWQASDVVVMKNLLNRCGTVDDQIKWEAIATARGLCTLTDNCTCEDCRRAKYLNGVADGDGGLGAAPLLNAISVGCSIQ